MNREHPRKYPSIRNNLGFEDKRESAILPPTSDLKPLTSSSKDLSKQALNKLRLRKRSSIKTENLIK